MSEELHAKLVGFLSGEFARKEGRQCTKVDLLYAQPNYRDETLRTWDREETPDLFDNFALVEKLVAEIIEIAEGHADSFGMGQHRFVVRTHQHLGGRATTSFKLAPSYQGAEDGTTALAQRGSGGGNASADAALSVLTQNNQGLMRTNQAMFQSSFGTLASLADNLRSENVELRAENASLKKRLDEAESLKEEKQFQIAMEMEAQQRKGKGLDQLMQFGTIALAKMTGGGPEFGQQSPLAIMVFKFGESLRSEQIATLMSTLDIGQKALFMEIMQAVAPKEDKAPGASAPQASNGANGAPHP